MERFYDIYFAAFPIGRLDSYKQKVLPLPKRQEQKVSGMCPV